MSRFFNSKISGVVFLTCRSRGIRALAIRTYFLPRYSFCPSFNYRGRLFFVLDHITNTSKQQIFKEQSVHSFNCYAQTTPNVILTDMSKNRAFALAAAVAMELLICRCQTHRKTQTRRFRTKLNDKKKKK